MSIDRKIRFLISPTNPVKKCTLLDIGEVGRKNVRVKEISADAYVFESDDKVSVKQENNGDELVFHLSTVKGDTAKVVISLHTGDCVYTWLSGRSMAATIACVYDTCEIGKHAREFTLDWTSKND